LTVTEPIVFRLKDLAATGAIVYSDGYRTRRDELGLTGFPILRAGDLTNEGGLQPAFKDHVEERFRSKIGQKLTRTGDVVVTTKGTVGRVAQVPAGAPEHAYSPQLCFLRVLDQERIDPGWLYCWARSPEFRRQLGVYKDQTDMAPYVSLTDLARVQITVPPIELQREVAEALSHLDGLIEAEHRIAQELDDLVRLEGRRFLRSLETGDTTPLPELAAISKGYSYKSAELREGGGWLVNLKNVGRDGSFQARGFKPLTATPKPAQIVDTGDVLVAQTDLTQSRDVIGRPVRVRRGLVRGPLTASLDLVIVRPLDGVPREYLYAVLDSPEFRAHALGYTNGTTVVHMGAAALPNYVAPAAPPEAIRGFSSEVAALRAEADAAVEAAERLEAVRAELLPLLVSGRVTPTEVTA
jgi:type I restriction enzyme S subunit